MNLQDSETSQGASAMYQAQHEVSPVTDREDYRKDGYAPRDKEENYRGGYRGGGRGRGKGSYRKPGPCTLCWPKRHLIEDCRFNTPTKKRDQLVRLDRCQACGVRVYEHGPVCSHKARCAFHRGEQHLTYTCDGPDFKHPGPQMKFPIADSPQNPTEVKTKAQAENTPNASS